MKYHIKKLRISFSFAIKSSQIVPDKKIFRLSRCAPFSYSIFRIFYRPSWLVCRPLFNNTRRLNTPSGISTKHFKI